MDQFVFDSELGYMGVALQGSTLLALVFGHSNERTARSALSQRTRECPDHDDWALSDLDPQDLISRLREFALGQPTDFSDLAVDTSGTTPFQRRVLAACRAIAWGETCSYGQLAQSVGRPGAARAVGAVMASNRVPLVIPCHRVVAASGGLGGFSAPQGLAMKRRLLAAEQSPPSAQPSSTAPRELAATR